MGTWNTITTSEMAITEHKQQTAKANRTGWMIDEAARSRARRTIRTPHRHLVMRVAAVAVALGGIVLAGPLT